MRPLVALLALALVSMVLSGCLGSAPAPMDPTGQAPDPRPAAAPSYPDALDVTDDIALSLDPLILVDGSICSAPSAQCRAYPFDVNATTEMLATLTWGVELNDLDLHLQRGDSVSSASMLPPGNVEALALTLEPGTYMLVVAGFVVTQDTYRLVASFGPPADA